MTANAQPHRVAATATLGTFLLFSGVLLGILRVIERTQGIPAMPRFWYANQALWFLISGGFIAIGIFCLAPQSELPLRWRPSRPGIRFRQLVVYTRTGCHLCDEALALLHRYRRWLPQVTEFSIDDDAKLVEKYGTCVPVIVCDGKVRFRGHVHPQLLERLIEGTPPT